MSGLRALFVDRDGVINDLVPDPESGLPESPLREQDVFLIDGAADALRRLAAAGFLLVGVSNQPAAAKGKVPLAKLDQVQQRVLELLAAGGVRFDAFRICVHHPDAVVSSLRGPCGCRKPAPGMLLHAACELGIDLAASWMIGDTDADILAGRAAGCRTALLLYPGSGHKRVADPHPDAVARSLDHAATVLLDPIP